MKLPWKVFKEQKEEIKSSIQSHNAFLASSRTVTVIIASPFAQTHYFNVHIITPL